MLFISHTETFSVADLLSLTMILSIYLQISFHSTNYIKPNSLCELCLGKIKSCPYIGPDPKSFLDITPSKFKIMNSIWSKYSGSTF